MAPRHVHHYFRLEQHCLHREPVSVSYAYQRDARPLNLMLCHRLATPCTSFLKSVPVPRHSRSCGQGGQRLMLPLVLSSFFASALHILRGDTVSDSTAFCRDSDTYRLCTRFNTSRVVLERLILFSSTRIRGTQRSRRTFHSVFIYNPLPTIQLSRMMSPHMFDNTGRSYNVSRILTPQSTLDEEAYGRYSPLFLSYVDFTFSFSLIDVSGIVLRLLCHMA